MGRKAGFWILAILFVLATCAVAESSTEHVYINGKIMKISTEHINISGKDYELAKGVRVVKHVKKGGAIYEEPARRQDLSIGKSVSAKVLGGVVYEIIVETYK